MNGVEPVQDPFNPHTPPSAPPSLPPPPSLPLCCPTLTSFFLTVSQPATRPNTMKNTAMTTSGTPNWTATPVRSKASGHARPHTNFWQQPYLGLASTWATVRLCVVTPGLTSKSASVQ